MLEIPFSYKEKMHDSSIIILFKIHQGFFLLSFIKILQFDQV
jgi:hypothetical protein